MSAYDEGFKARLRGVGCPHNPHPFGTPERHAWAVGWKDQDKHLKDRDEALESIGWFGRFGR